MSTPQKQLDVCEQGDTFFSNQQYAEALAAYEQFILLAPDEPRGYEGKGNSLKHLGRYDEAFLAYEEGVRLKDVGGYIGIASVLANLHKHQEAIRIYEQAALVDPNEPIIYLNKGASLLKLEHYEEALFAYKQAITLDPKKFWLISMQVFSATALNAMMKQPNSSSKLFNTNPTLRQPSSPQLTILPFLSSPTARL